MNLLYKAIFSESSVTKCQYIVQSELSVMKKPTFCICKIKGADQLHSNGTADQHLCFRYIHCTIPQNFKPLTIFCGLTALFVSDMVENPKDRCTRDVAQMLKYDKSALERVCVYAILG